MAVSRGNAWQRFAAHLRRRHHARRQAGGDRFHISLHARNLAGEEHIRMIAQLQRVVQQRRRIDVSVAMNLPVAQEFRILEPRNQPQDALLLGKRR